MTAETPPKIARASSREESVGRLGWMAYCSHQGKHDRSTGQTPVDKEPKLRDLDSLHAVPNDSEQRTNTRVIG